MVRSLEDLRQFGGLSLIQADAQRLLLPNQAVDVAMHMLYHVPDIPAAIAELRRITRADGTVLVSTNSSGHLAEIHELLSVAVSSRLGRTVQTMPALSFTTQTGGAMLSREFSTVTLRTLDVPLSRLASQPVIAYVASLREPILAWIGEPLDFDAVLDGIAMKVEQAIQARAVSGLPPIWAYSSAGESLRASGSLRGVQHLDRRQIALRLPQRPHPPKPGPFPTDPVHCRLACRAHRIPASGSEPRMAALVLGRCDLVGWLCFEPGGCPRQV